MSQPDSLGVLVDHAQDKIVLLDEAGRFTYANDAVERRFGYEPADLVGENAFEYIHPDDVEKARAAFERTIAPDEFTETTVEYRLRASDGAWIWVESRMSNLTDEALDGYVVSSRDISDRVAAERDQRATATRLEELAAVAGDVLWMFDGDWSELLFANPAYESVYGRPVADLEADPRSFLDTVHPDDVPRVEAGLECLSDGVPVDMEYRVNPDRDYGVWVWVQAEPIVVDGEVARITGFSRDVTDRRRRRQQLYVMDNLLRHNLRNDLTKIVGNAELIEDDVPEAAERTAVIRRTCDELLASAEKQREMIDILTGDVRTARVDVTDVVADGVSAVTERHPEASVAVETPASAPACTMAELRLAVAELIENSVRHSERDRPSVRVTVERDGEGVVVTVRDDAPRIPEIEARVLTGDHEMDDVYHSSGLGLWLVYWIVELSDGEITVAAADGPGNVVRLALPAPPE